MARDRKRTQKAAQKKKSRELKVRREKARQRTEREGAGSKSTLREAGELELYECVISKGWKKRGMAHILLTKRMRDGRLMVGGYFVDILCLGLKDTAVIPGVEESEYKENLRDNIFNDEVTFEKCDPGVARAIIEGAIEFAAEYGFAPAKKWKESSRLLKSYEPKGDKLVFGKKGKPHLTAQNDINRMAVIAKLEKKAGEGNFTTEEVEAE